jgi:hypothetical protein
MIPTRLAGFIIGRRFAPTRWQADLPISKGGVAEAGVTVLDTADM